MTAVSVEETRQTSRTHSATITGTPFPTAAWYFLLCTVLVTRCVHPAEYLLINREPTDKISNYRTY